MKTIEEITQSYYEFLATHGAKEKLKKIIDTEIKKWKKCKAYEWRPNKIMYDHSGELYEVVVKGRTQKIGDVCKTDVDVLQAYSGFRMPTFCSGYGFHYTTVAEEMSSKINDFLYDLRYKWIIEHCDELMDGQEQDYKSEQWDDDEICEYVDNEILSSELLHYDWMFENFPEYLVSKDSDNEFYIERPPEVPFEVYS